MDPRLLIAVVALIVTLTLVKVIPDIYRLFDELAR
jgi:type II secretory pathway component PulF